MTEEERQSSIKVLSSKLDSLTSRREELQRSLCTVISNIELTRQQLRDLGYQHPRATGT